MLENVFVEGFQGDFTKPCLVLQPSSLYAESLLEKAKEMQGNNDSDDEATVSVSPKEVERLSRLLKTLRIRLIPTLSGVEPVFALRTLVPDWNNVRPWTLGYKKPESVNSNLLDQSLTPTPVYNSAITEDVAFKWFLTAAHSALKDLPNARSALAILKLWVHRLGWNRQNSHLSSTLMTAIVVHLVQQNGIHDVMSVLQVLRKVFMFLSEGGLLEPILLRAADDLSTMTSASESVNSSGSESEAEEEDNENESEAGSDGSDGSDGEDENEVDEANPSDEEGSDSETHDEVVDEEENENDDEMDGDEEDPFSKALVDPLKRSSPSAADSILDQFRRHFPIVIVCPSGIHNMAYRMTQAAALEVQHAAKLALVAVTGEHIEKFKTQEEIEAELAAIAAEKKKRRAQGYVPPPPEPENLLKRPMGNPNLLLETVFSSVVPLVAMYDRTMTIPIPACPYATFEGEMTADLLKKKLSKIDKRKKSSSSSTDMPEIPMFYKKLANYGSWYTYFQVEAEGLLKKALGDRVTNIRLIPQFPESSTTIPSPAATNGVWSSPISLTWSPISEPNYPTSFLLCVTVDATNAIRMVERGPAPEKHKEAADFVALWGSKLCELRRFQDGAITHSVVWDAEKLGGRVHARMAIVPLICAYMLARHFGCKVPLTLLHAGDAHSLSMKHIVPKNLTSNEAERRAAVEKHLIESYVLSDLAQNTPSLALERVLDIGSLGTTITSINIPSIPEEVPTQEESGIQTPEISQLTGVPSLPVSNLPTLRTMPLPPSTDPKLDASVHGPLVMYRKAIVTLDTIINAFRTIPSLPLPVLSHKPISPFLRYTSPFPPSAHPLCAATGNTKGVQLNEKAEKLTSLLGAADGEGLEALPTFSDFSGLATALAHVEANYLSLVHNQEVTGVEPSATQVHAPLEVVLVLTSSDKWTDSPSAIQHLKTAMITKMQAGLQSQYRGLVVATAHKDYLDVMAGGFVYRFYLHVEQEISALSKATKRIPLTKGLASLLSSEFQEMESDEEDENEEGDILESDTNDANNENRRPVKRIRGFLIQAGEASKEITPLSRVERRKNALAAGFKGALPMMSEKENKRRLDEVYNRKKYGEDMWTRRELTERLDALVIRGVAKPTHGASIHAISQRFPTYSSSVRLALLWLQHVGFGLPAWVPATSAHAEENPFSILSAFREDILVPGNGEGIPLEAVELLIASVYLHPAPFAGPPNSPTTAFLRFLMLLAGKDWEEEPLIVDLHGDMPMATVNAFLKRFKQIRKGKIVKSNEKDAEAFVYPPVDSHAGGPALYLVSSNDTDLHYPLWTRYKPSWPVLGKLVVLSGKALQALLQYMASPLPSNVPTASNLPKEHTSSLKSLPTIIQGVETSLVNRFLSDSNVSRKVPNQSAYRSWSSLFRPVAPLSGFDLAISCKSSMVPRLAIDGRTMGLVKPPVESAFALMKNPREIVQPLLKKVLASEKDVSVEQMTSGAGSRPSLVLAVENSEQSCQLNVILPCAFYKDISKFQLPLYKNLLRQSRNSLLLGTDPIVCFLRTLRKKYGAVASFFYISPSEQSKEPCIAVSWQQGAFKVRFKDITQELALSVKSLTTGKISAENSPSAAVTALLLGNWLQLGSTMAAEGSGIVKGVHLLH